MPLYESPDLRTWRYINLMYDHESSDSALTEGRMCECPQLIRLGDVDVLLLSILDDAPRHVVIVEGNLVGDRCIPRRSSLFTPAPHCKPRTRFSPKTGRIV